MREFTREEAETHNALTSHGWELLKDEILLNAPTQVKAPCRRSKQKLNQAREYFEQALTINPQGWSSLWAIGKIHQRLMQPEEAYYWFCRAHHQNPGQKDVAREAGLAALDLGRADDALFLCKTAVELDPSDVGLVANLSWAYLIAGDVGLAQATITQAVKADPGDVVSRNVLRVINEVASGTRPLPKTMLEVRSRG